MAKKTRFMAGGICGALLLTVLILTAQGVKSDSSAHCTRVIDGDTIELSTGERVRYIGINTVEPRDKLGKVITEFNRYLVEGKDIRLEFDIEKYDKYNRLLAYVYVDDVFVNATLVERGLAEVMTVPRTCGTENISNNYRRRQERVRGGYGARGDCPSRPRKDYNILYS